MAIIATFVKQPADVLDYEVDFKAFLVDGDALLSATAVAEPAEGILVQAPLLIDNDTALKIWVSGGVDATPYKITITATTVLGRIKQDEIRMRIRDY